MNTKKHPTPPVSGGRGDLRFVWLAALLFSAILVAYSPALNGGILWDDAAHVTTPELQSLRGLWRIWIEPGATQQYYPLLHSAFWIEHQLWGDSVLGYHLTNVILHTAAALLLVVILRRLSVPGAWLAGFLFALHPVCVEAVAWISEQKSTLSIVFYLGAALAYLHFDQTRKRSQYFLALGLFVLALLTKTVTATLPAALLVIFWWHRKRLDWKRDILPLVPWLVIGASAGLFTAWVERKFIGADGVEYALTLGQRGLLAGRVIWFYLFKLIWPQTLIFSYPHWTVDAAVWWQYLFPAGILALVGSLLWIARRHRGPLAGFLFFAGTLFPVLGFFNVYPFRFSYVADHFQYVATLGIIVPIAAGIALAVERIPTSARPIALGALLAALGVLTFRQSTTYVDDETIFRETLARNPDSWIAHINLGLLFAKTPSRIPEAIEEWRTALRIKPNATDAHYNLGVALGDMPGRLPDAIAEYQAEIRIQPRFPTSYLNLANALATYPERLPEAISEYRTFLRLTPNLALSHYSLAAALSRSGSMQEAIEEYRAAIRIEPTYVDAHTALGLALAQTPQHMDEAISEFQAAVRLNPNSAEAHSNLGIALSRAPGRLSEAISEFEASYRIRPDPAVRLTLDRLGAN